MLFFRDSTMQNYIIIQFITVKGCLYEGGNKYKSHPIEIYKYV